MPEPSRHHYVVDLSDAPGSDPWLDFEVDLRPPTESDRDELAVLMLEAYRGTIDYEGETLKAARQEVSSYFESSPLLTSSYVALIDGTLAGAILLSNWEGKPLVGYVMTRPEYKNQGLGTLLLRESLRALREAGETKVHAFITEGNTASEALFRGAGGDRVAGEDG